RAVVASRVGGILELIRDGKTGLLVEPGDVDGLAARLRQLLADPKRARELGRAGQELALAKYDVTTMAIAYDRTYRELLTPTKELLPCASFSCPPCTPPRSPRPSRRSTGTCSGRWGTGTRSGSSPRSRG